MKEKIAQILYDELNYAYCDNCEGNDSQDPNYCEYCHRKEQNWALRKRTAEYLADKIIKECGLVEK